MIYVLATALFLSAWRYFAHARRCGTFAVMRELAAALAAGALAGAVLGLSARVAMRLLAIGTGAPLRLTSEGTSVVIVVFTGMGIVLAFPYAAVLRGFVRRSSLAYAAVLALVTFPPFLRTAAEDLGEAAWDARVVGGTCLVSLLMWVPYAAVLELTLARVSRGLGAWARAGRASA